MWTVAAKTSDIKQGRPHQVTLNGLPIALFRMNDKFFALSAICPHKEGPLGMGYMDGMTVHCPMHGWGFDISTGICRDYPDKPVPCYPVRVVGDQIEIELP